MDQPKYRIEIFWSDEDGGYIANVPDLRYCSAFGETYEEALREVIVAMKLHLDTLKELGRPIPEPTARRVVGVRADVSDPGGTFQIVEEVSVSTVDNVAEVVEQLADAYAQIVEDTSQLVGGELGEGAGQLVGDDLVSQRALTPREREVLQLLAEGKTNREIAEHLSVSLSAVRRHLDRVMNAHRLSMEATRSASEIVAEQPPIGGYDEMNISEITQRLDNLSDTELAQVRDYERRNKNRETLLAQVERRMEAS